MPGAMLVKGAIVGAWQRQPRRVPIHPFADAMLSARLREAIEEDDLTFPVAGSSSPTVAWGCLGATENLVRAVTGDDPQTLASRGAGSGLQLDA